MTQRDHGEIAFQPVERGDYALLAEWLRRPHWQEWWGEPETELGYIRDMVEGRDLTCRPFLFAVTDRPAGYIQFWHVAPHQRPEWADDNPWLMQVPATAVGVDLSLADGDRLGQGIGSAVLRRFCEQLWSQGYRTIVIDPDPGNGRAVAAYRKAGFRPMPEVTSGTDAALIMQFHSDKPAS
ncbi:MULTISPECIES: acetyltransferase [Bosea]|uniref:acetyltransferase n=1 Tax=Bosea TaxID=85413 RepID=UPI00214F6E56|nr:MULTISPECIES: acetyltransferase [Bosea]MCR4521915.1 acetyltransferase [Bosea sp. 47.2.35]MDR6829608.1 aminoglycoside 6'-N-acetyltransferase [Bosea robiniae]MDR6896491.1 aminoglycoside 6'-N-acetyltransferase [Bosea sp. BE109]MDR7139889.1 aminoglycoside 6'-N-acetyltransferase [Bosea sp. BE168]MDR7176389.1 aminoglycoside 6'-N-acetyltransferase [Bosea sp. BE271]